MFRLPCKDYLKGTCNNSIFVKKWHPPECLFYKTKSGCRFGKSAHKQHRQVDEQPSKRSKTNNDKKCCGYVEKIHDNWAAYFRIWSRRGLHRFCGKAQTYGSQYDVFNSLKPCYVTLKFETKNPSIGYICPGEPHQRSPNAPKI